MKFTRTCPNFEVFPFVGYLRRPEIWEMITYLFCKAEYRVCKRYIRKKCEGKVPPDLWPIETVSISEILQGLNFDFHQILNRYRSYFTEFEQSDEYWELFERGVVQKFKERFKEHINAFLVFFGRYYEDLFLGDFNQSFFIEMAYLYEEKKIEDSVFDSVFLVFISALEEHFIKWLEKKKIDAEEKSSIIFALSRINTLALMLLKKNIKLIQEIKQFYTSKNNFLKFRKNFTLILLQGLIIESF